MSPEWFPIIHDAVKIGLGALIGGTFSLWTSRITSRHRNKEDLTSKRRERLVELSRELAQLHTLFVAQWATTIGSLSIKGQRSKGAKALMNILEEELFEREPEIYNALLKLHEVEAEMSLIGAFFISDAIEQYRFAVVGLHDFPEKARTEDQEVVLKFQHSHVTQKRMDVMMLMMRFYELG